MKRFFLELLDGPQEGLKREVTSSLTMGRSQGNDLVFSGEASGIVSARHALVALKAQSLWLRDLDSTNGTFVGKSKVIERELLGGEFISLGPAGPALRVLVVNMADPIKSDTAILAYRPGDTTSMARVDVGLLEDLGTTNRGVAGSKSLILEMAKRLRRTSRPDEVMQGMLQDPERLTRLLRGGVMPERVADWMGSLGKRFAKSRRRIFWIGGVVGALFLAAVAILAVQNLDYRDKLKQQGSLLTQIHQLETGLDGLADSGMEATGEKAKLVRRLLAAEKQLLQIREKLRIPDRVPTYRVPLGSDIHRLLEELGKKGFIVPESFIRSVQVQIDFFRAPANRATLVRCFARKPRFEALIRQELARMKLPLDFLYIAMQESLLDSLALSGSEARGLWQLVPETARDLGLAVPEDWQNVSSVEDERTRPRASTRAAAKYLHQLYSEFGDAALAMAAYNAGGNRMRRVLRKIEDPVSDRDFWYLYRMGLMHDETNEYVPKIMAIILIDRNRKKYGF